MIRSLACALRGGIHRLKRLLTVLLAAPAALALIAFAVANRRWVEISFDPFSPTQPFAAISAPLWSLFFAGLMAGVIWGWIMAWLAQRKKRRAARRLEKATLQKAGEHARLTGVPVKNPYPASGAARLPVPDSPKPEAL